MKSKSPYHSFFIPLLSIFLLIMGYVLLAPTKLGGAVTYVIVDGNSMEPNFHLGDLVLVRTEPDYQIGDAVTYQNAELGRYVFHRIVAVNLDHFVLQGDHNSWLDTYNPGQGEIVGKLWVHIPKLGKVIEWVRSPFHMALTVALLGGVLMSDVIVKPNQHGKKKNKAMGNFNGMPQGMLYILGFLSLAFLGLTIFSFSQPLTRPAENIPYQQDGNFFYSATGTAGVYDTALIRPGEPIFPKLTCFMNVGFTYNLTSNGLQESSGSQQMYARVIDEQSGWQRTIPMGQATAFTGNSYFATSTLDLCQVQSLVTLVEQETGLHPSTYTLEIITHVEFDGKILGTQVNDTFDPSLAFKFDKAHFYLAASGAQTDPLHSTKQGLAGNRNPQVNTLSIAGIDLNVRMLRVISLLGLGFSALSFVLVGINIYSTAQQNQDALIKLKYGSMLVDIYESNIESTTSTVDVTSIEDVVKLAERHGTTILHITKNLSDHYLVQTQGTTYRYVTGADKNTMPQTTPLEHIKVETQKNHKANPRPAINQNKTARRIVDHHTPVPVKNNPMGFLTNRLNQVAGLKNDPAIIENKPAWNENQNRTEPPVLITNVKNAIVSEASPEYAIQTGTIQFVKSEQEETVMLSRVKL